MNGHAVWTLTHLDLTVSLSRYNSNWFRAPSDSWTERFDYVVGVIHTSTSNHHWVSPDPTLTCLIVNQITKSMPHRTTQVCGQHQPLLGYHRLW